MRRTVFFWIKKYERHLSALAMIAGFIADNVVFTRIDLWQTQALFAAYAIACFVAIPLLCWFEARAAREGAVFPRWRLFLPFVTQFALGGFWSGFVIFYGRSATVGASWPFLLFVFLVFLGSEYFHRYHARLVFTSVLFFFALYSYAIFEIPLFTGHIGTETFLLSGVSAIGIFILFTTVVRRVARERFLSDIRRIRIGALAVLVIMNVFYFTNILPPLPLSATAAGVYHSVARIPGTYIAATEVQPWWVTYLGFSPTLHVLAGEPLSAYSAVFAPTTVSTTIVHRWEWYDPERKRWILRATISYTIVGGRDGGYRGYSTARAASMGKWRVNIETTDGRLIARLPFTIEQVTRPPAEETIVLQ
jgi:hypothetical protein